MSKFAQSFFHMTRAQRACLPVLVGWPIMAYFVPGELGLVFTLTIYFYIGGVTNCRWPCMLALFGALVGLAFEPAVFGGTIESRMQARVFRYATGAGIGLLVGLEIMLIKDANRNDLNADPQTKDSSRKDSRYDVT